MFVYKTYRNDRSSLLFKKNTSFTVNNSTILNFKKAKFSEHYFYMEPSV